MAERSPRVYFYCNAIPERVRVARQIETDSPAATRKVLAMSRALRTAGVEVVLVSMGRSANLRGRIHRARVLRQDGQPVVVGPLWEIPLLSRVVSAIWLAALSLRAARRTNRSTRHLFYNQLALYIPALTILSLLGRKTAVDIEDGPLSKRQSLSGRFGANAPWLFERLITGGAVLATSQLAHGTDIRPVVPCYGAIGGRAPVGRDRFIDGPLHVLLAGFITRETGQPQFERAIAQMRSKDDPIFDSMVIEIAGTGPGIAELKSLEAGTRPEVRVAGRLNAADYAALLARSHIGLSLKPVGGLVSQTTFPSKTVEFAEHGLALITTDISDVRAVFGDGVWYLDSEDPGQLIEKIALAQLDREGTFRMARRGQAHVLNTLSHAAVGLRLRDFLFGEHRHGPVAGLSAASPPTNPRTEAVT